MLCFNRLTKQQIGETNVTPGDDTLIVMAHPVITRPSDHTQFISYKRKKGLGVELWAMAANRAEESALCCNLFLKALQISFNVLTDRVDRMHYVHYVSFIIISFN